MKANYEFLISTVYTKHFCFISFWLLSSETIGVLIASGAFMQQETQSNKEIYVNPGFARGRCATVCELAMNQLS